MAIAIHWTSSAKRPVGIWVAGWAKVVGLSSVLSGGSADGVELIMPVGYNRAVNEASTCWLLRYTTSAKPAFRFEYVHAYCQLAVKPGKHFCGKILT